MRVIVVGDVHGCLEELDALLRLVSFRRGRDRLILAGDLVDRGPDPLGVCRRARELGAEPILGNHEEKHVRMARRDAEERVGGKKNKMQPFDPVRRVEHERLQAEEMIDWMRSWPLYRRFEAAGRPWVVVHAGLEPGKAIEAQDPNVLVRCRYVLDDKMSSSFDLKPGSVPWPQAWRGPENVVYGHIVHWLKPSPYVNSLHAEGSEAPVNTLGIDAGCCFGGHLMAAVFDPVHDHPAIAAVLGRATGHRWRGPDSEHED